MLLSLHTGSCHSIRPACGNRRKSFHLLDCQLCDRRNCSTHLHQNGSITKLTRVMESNSALNAGTETNRISRLGGLVWKLRRQRDRAEKASDFVLANDVDSRDELAGGITFLAEKRLDIAP